MRVLARKGIRAGLTVGLTIALLGCSGSDEASAPVPAPAPAPAPAAPVDETPSLLRIGVVPGETVVATLDTWGAIISILETELGIPVQLFEATDLAAVIEAAIAGDLDVVHLGPFAQVIARDNGARLRTVGATSPDSQGPRNAAVAVVRSDSPITELSQLAGQDVCFISPGSTTGYLFGAAALDEIGIDPETGVNGIFTSDHFSGLRTMFDGECAAVFTFREGAEVIWPAQEDDVEPEDLRIVWSIVVPEGGISISTDLPVSFQDRLADLMLSINGDDVYAAGLCPANLVREYPDGSSFCAVIANFWGLQAADESYWAPVKAVCEATNAPACGG
jgi:phosphonate transport system substrate-binding protein